MSELTPFRMSYRPGDVPVPDHRLIRVLGKGAYGVAWEAVGPGGVHCALKVIRLDWLSGDKGRREFKAMQMVKNLRHPNLVPITGLWLRDSNGSIRESLSDAEGDSDGESGSETHDNIVASDGDSDIDSAAQLFIAMGLCEMTLSDVLQQRRDAGHAGIPRAELLQYMEGAAAAIDYLHIDCKVIHRDVKPQNILLVGGKSQVGDFGLAREVSDLRSTISRGTKAYWAPEAGTKSESFSIDQFSLAIAYLELRRGVLPYRDSDSEEAVLLAKARGDFDLTGLSRAEARVVRKALSLDPQKRYRSCGAFVDALQRAHVWKYAWIYSAAAVALLALAIYPFLTDPLAVLQAEIDGNNIAAAMRTIARQPAYRLSAADELLVKRLGELEYELNAAGRGEPDEAASQEKIEELGKVLALANAVSSDLPASEIAETLRAQLEPIQMAWKAAALRQLSQTVENERAAAEEIQAYLKKDGRHPEYERAVLLRLLNPNIEQGNIRLLSEFWALPGRLTEKEERRMETLIDDIADAIEDNTPRVDLVMGDLKKIPQLHAAITARQQWRSQEESLRDKLKNDDLPAARSILTSLEAKAQESERRYLLQRYKLARLRVALHHLEPEFAELHGFATSVGAEDDVDQLCQKLAQEVLSARTEEKTAQDDVLMQLWSAALEISKLRDTSLSEAQRQVVSETHLGLCRAAVPAAVSSRPSPTVWSALQQELPQPEAAIVALRMIEHQATEAAKGDATNRSLQQQLAGQVQEQTAHITEMPGADAFAWANQYAQYVAGCVAVCCGEPDAGSEQATRLEAVMENACTWESLDARWATTARRHQLVGWILKSAGRIPNEPLPSTIFTAPVGPGQAWSAAASRCDAALRLLGPTSDDCPPELQELVARGRLVQVLGTSSAALPTERQLALLATQQSLAADSALLARKDIRPLLPHFHFASFRHLLSQAMAGGGEQRLAELIAAAAAVVEDAQQDQPNRPGFSALCLEGPGFESNRYYQQVLSPTLQLIDEHDFAGNANSRPLPESAAQAARLHEAAAFIVRTRLDSLQTIERAVSHLQKAIALEASADRCVDAAFLILRRRDYQNQQQRRDSSKLATDITADAEKLKPGHAGAAAVRAHLELLAATEIHQLTQRKKAVERAIAAYQAAETGLPPDSRWRVLLYEGLSAASTDLGYIDGELAAQAGQDRIAARQAHVANAIKHAQRATQVLSPDLDFGELAWLTLGHAQEDAAHFLGQLEKYDDAIKSLREARKIVRNIGGIRRAEVLHSLGRCQLRAALKCPTQENLQLLTRGSSSYDRPDTESCLDSALQDWEDQGRDRDRAETQFWRGEMWLLRGRLRLEPESISAEKALACFAQSSELARQNAPSLAAAAEARRAHALGVLSRLATEPLDAAKHRAEAQAAALAVLDRAVDIVESSEQHLIVEAAQQAWTNYAVACAARARGELSLQPVLQAIDGALEGLCAVSEDVLRSRKLLIEELRLCRAEAAVRGIREGRESDPNVASLSTNELLASRQSLARLVKSEHAPTVLRARHLLLLLDDPSYQPLTNWGKETERKLLEIGNQYAALLNDYDKACPPTVASEVNRLAATPISKIEGFGEGRDPALNLALSEHLQRTRSLRIDCGRVSGWVITECRLASATEKSQHRAAVATALKPLLDRSAETDPGEYRRLRQHIDAVLR